MAQRRCKDWIKSYLQFTELTEAPEIFHFWTAIATLGGALRRRVWIDNRQFMWLPNFYVIFVAPPGVVQKTTTIDAGMNLLKRVPGVHFGSKSGTWQAIADRLAEVQELTFATPGDIMSESVEMAALNFAIGELGTFLDFNDEKLISVLTDLWDGKVGSFEHSTRTSGTVTIINPWVNMIGATTPSWLKRNAGEGVIGDGFASRVIWVYGNKKRRLVAYPGLLQPKRDWEAKRDDLVHDLEMISQLYGEFLMTPEAITWGEKWYEENYYNRDSRMTSERFDGYFSRKQSHIHKVAMVLSASLSNDLVIDKDHLERACQYVTSTEPAMMAVFESVGTTSINRHVQTMIRFINSFHKRKKAPDRQTLWRAMMMHTTQSEFDEALDSCKKAGYVKIVMSGGTQFFRLAVDPAELGIADDAEADKLTQSVMPRGVSG